MIDIQSLPCFVMDKSHEKTLTVQPQSVNSQVDKEQVSSNNANIFENDGSLIDQNSAVFFKFLIKKYKRQMGDMAGNDVCSGGLQQFLIKQQERQQKKRCEQIDEGQLQSRFECLPVDVRLHIFSYLTATELCRASRVCRSWYDITEDNLLWAGLMERDIHKWNVIGHNTNPAMYKEVESEWTNKEVYLRCSPEVNKLMHQQNAVFSNITSMLRYFLPKKTPMFTMFGPGLETQTSGIVRKIMHESGLQKVGLFPGKFDGVGGGITMKSETGSTFHLSVMYSASKKEREQTNRDRNQAHKLMRENKDGDATDKYELLPAVQDFCKTVDGFIYVVDSTMTSPAVENGLSELLAMVNERWSATYVPVLILSAVTSPDTHRLSCFEVVERLNLTQLNRPWQVRNCDIQSLSGIFEGFSWLSEQTQRR